MEFMAGNLLKGNIIDPCPVILPKNRTFATQVNPPGSLPISPQVAND